eukprot:5198792-Alexandrium_andersonii.AAC.1
MKACDRQRPRIREERWVPSSTLRRRRRYHGGTGCRSRGDKWRGRPMGEPTRRTPSAVAVSLPP